MIRDTLYKYSPIDLLLSLNRFHYASKNLENGMYLTLVHDALNDYDYIDLNSKNKISFLVFDLDYKQSSMAWYDEGLPEPSWICQNPKNGHSHVVYLLETPVSTSKHSSQRLILFLERINQHILLKLNSDVAYNQKLTKNPLRFKWRTFWGRKEKYSLNEFTEYLPDDLKKVMAIPNNNTTEVGSRNVTLFDNVRKYCYQQCKNFLHSLKGLHIETLRYAKAYNKSFEEPLLSSEVLATTKSIVKWTFKYIKQNFINFKLKQKFRSRLRLRKRKHIISELFQKIFKSKVSEIDIDNNLNNGEPIRFDKNGLTSTKIAEMFDVSLRTIRRIVSEKRETYINKAENKKTDIFYLKSEGYSLKDISEMLRISYNYVRKIVSQSKKNMELA